MLIVTTDLEKDGTPKKDKDGNIRRSFRMPKEDDWTLLKKKTEFDIDNSRKTVGCYIYDSLLINPNQKIIGKLVRTVERKYYKEELRQILEVQKALIPELQDEALYKACIEEIYPTMRLIATILPNRILQIYSSTTFCSISGRSKARNH